MEHLWEFMAKHLIEKGDDMREIELLRERDCTLLKKSPAVARDGMISKEEWATANKFRIYKQLYNVSDAATGNGSRIDEFVFDRDSWGQEGRIRNIM